MVERLKIEKRKEALEEFYSKIIKELDFFTRKPVNAMVNRFLINRMLYELYEKGPLSPKDLINTVYKEGFNHKKPEWLINGTYFPFARDFHLVKKDNLKRICLTKLGKKYVEADKKRPIDISSPQAQVIRDYIIKNPFKSKIINGIYNFVEVVLEILRNPSMPSEIELINYYTCKSGKLMEWIEEKTRKTQYKYYKNLCVELELICEIEKRLFITPIGYSLIIQLQLNRVREMVNPIIFFKLKE